jgi:flagellar hook-associated protein 2
MVDSVSSSTTATTSTSYSQNRNEFDTDALVEAAVSAKLARADSISTQLTANETKVTAYQDMQTKLLAVQDALDVLRSAPGTAGAATDVFRNREAYLTSGTSTSADSILAATVDDGTDIGTHEIQVQQVAKAAKLGGANLSSRSGDLGWAGDFTLGTATGSTSIAVTATMSLDDIRDAINAENTTTGITASVIKVSDSQYMLVLTADETNQTITLAAGSGDDVLTELGVTDSDGEVANELQAAQPAILKINGVTITRSSNDIDDALDGVTLHLYRADPGNTLQLEVANNLSDIKEAVQTLVEAYNTFRDFVIQNQTTNSDGTKADDATLFGDSTLRAISSQLQQALSSSLDGHSLSEIGITFDSNNKLELDEDTLDNVLLDDLDTIKTLFAYRMDSSSGDLKLLSHGDGPANADFTLDVTVDSSGKLTGAGVGGDTSLFTVSGSTIRGVAGTDYEGLVLVYTGESSRSISVSITQGIADQLFQSVDAVADEYDGQLTGLIQDLEDADTTLQDRITRIENDAETYRTYLLSKYARIEAKLAEAQSVLDLFDALANANND